MFIQFRERSSIYLNEVLFFLPVCESKLQRRNLIAVFRVSRCVPRDLVREDPAFLSSLLPRLYLSLSRTMKEDFLVRRSSSLESQSAEKAATARTCQPVIVPRCNCPVSHRFGPPSNPTRSPKTPEIHTILSQSCDRVFSVKLSNILCLYSRTCLLIKQM